VWAPTVHWCPIGLRADVDGKWARRVGLVPFVRRWSSRRFPYGYLVHVIPDSHQGMDRLISRSIRRSDLLGSWRAASEGLYPRSLDRGRELPCGLSASIRPCYRIPLVPSQVTEEWW